MEIYAPKFSKVLVTPDPHYIPGYTGHCPQLKFNIGKTYSQLTAALLTDPEVTRSERLVLQGHVLPTDTHSSSSDSNLNRMLPGYTGFVPGKQNYFSCNSSEACQKALTDFYQEQQVKLQREATKLPIVVSSMNQHADTPKPALTVSSNKPFCSMEDDNPHDYFISEHVPKSCFRSGTGFPITTNQALIQFEKQQTTLMPQEVSGGKNSATPSMPTMYSTHRDAVPGFTGHMPGYRFMYGHTFGQLSRSALGKSHINRILQEKS